MRPAPPRAFAAGLIVQVVSAPQLFIEGNRRSATLLASYVLARSGLPPLVIAPNGIGEYRAIMESLGGIERSGGLRSRIAIMGAVGRSQALIESMSDSRFLLPNALTP